MKDAQTTEPHSLTGQVVVVTGGARRVGQAICEALWASGAHVVIHHFESHKAAQALAERLGSRVTLARADLRDRHATTAMFADLAAQLGRIDGLVCSAAIFGRTPLQTLTDDEWDDILAVNLTAPRRCMQLAIGHGAKAIVHIVDVAALTPWRGYAAYGVAKAGLLQLTKIAAKELLGSVRVNAVAPGLVLLPDDVTAEERARLLRKLPHGQMGSPHDVARAVQYLLTEPFVTGVCLPIDGGQSLG